MEAQTYCRFFNKRLPQEWEYQYAAQSGLQYNIYPWGNEDDQSLYPQKTSDRNNPDRPSEVNLYSNGTSRQYSLYDLVGNVWQFTSISEDTHTTRAILKGGSKFLPIGR